MRVGVITWVSMGEPASLLGHFQVGQHSIAATRGKAGPTCCSAATAVALSCQLPSCSVCPANCSSTLASARQGAHDTRTLLHIIPEIVKPEP